MALELHRGLASRGHEMSWWVGSNDGALPEARTMDFRANHVGAQGLSLIASGIHAVGKKIGLRRLRAYRDGERELLEWVEHPRRRWDEQIGWESFAYSGVRNLLKRNDFNPEVIQLHNLHGRYFDLRELPKMSRRFPTVITLHDAWMLSGHCAHSFDCERWTSGCGHCPDLTISPGIRRDGTRSNWKRKQRIYQNSRLRVISPSRWLTNRVSRSMLGASALRVETIPNGVDTTIFKREAKEIARRELDLPENSVVIFTLADPSYRNRWKDFRTLVEACAQLREGPESIVIMAVGAPEEVRREGRIEWRMKPKILSKESLARHYQAADLYVHSAHIENFPNMILEAMACECVVIGTDVGGISEQIDPNRNGWLSKAGDSVDLARCLKEAIGNQVKRQSMARAGWERVQNEWTLSLQMSRYERFYHEMMEGEKRR